VKDGLITSSAASAIRTSRLADETGSRLPGTFAMLGALMLAASVSAFVAANWQDIPRLVKLIGILAVIAGGFLIALRLEARAMPRGADAAVTFATLCFGAGIALVGQMYHLPADWPGGAMLVAIGALIAAALTGKDGPLVIAFVAMVAWSWGRLDVWQWRVPHWEFLLLFVPAFILALGRGNRLVAILCVLTLSFWLVTLFVRHIDEKTVFELVAAGLALSVVYMVAGIIARDRGGPLVLSAMLPVGALGFGLLLCFEVARVLDSSLYGRQSMTGIALPAYAAALLALGAFYRLVHDQNRARLVLMVAFVLGLCVPLLFLAGFGHLMIGRIVVTVTVLATAVALIAGGIMSGHRSIMGVGHMVFGLSLLILLWRTIGTLLDQSLFFLVAGLVLLALATAARKLSAFARSAAGMDGGTKTGGPAA
ncbi:MAG: DUF2157 domain-containing protein, partial [Bosea sp. (in: a-proteobacteria)]